MTHFLKHGFAWDIETEEKEPFQLEGIYSDPIVHMLTSSEVMAL